MTRTMTFLLAALVAGSTASAQPHAPIVTMNVTLPDGQSQQLTAPESGLATVKLKDGSEIGVRPTILDAKPWNRVLVTFFKAPAASEPGAELGSVEVRKGAAAAQSKTTPAFKVAVTNVAESAAPVEPTTSGR
jgi:hypothetical protein